MNNEDDNRAEHSQTIEEEAIDSKEADATEADTSSQLVSEDAIEDAIENEAPPPNEKEAHPPKEVLDFSKELKLQGFSPEIQQRYGNEESFRINIDLAAGRSKRTVSIDQESIPELDGIDLSRWRSLQRYNGIWSQLDGAIEVVLRSDRMGPTSRTILRQISEDEQEDNPDSGVELSHEETGVRLKVGPSSLLARILLGARFGFRRPTFLTARLDGVEISTSDQADEITERISDSLSFDLHVNLGIALTPELLEKRGMIRSRIPRRSRKFSFPRNSYPHAPILLYQAARNRTTAPLIRYWSYYQVLEFFFPKYSQAEALKQVSRLLRSPSFDAHRNEDILRMVQLASTTGRSAGSEEEQLITTLRSITTAAEVADFSQRAKMEDHLKDRKSELTKKAVKIDQVDDLLGQLGQRIYDIRCKIAHSKNGSVRDTGPGLLPGTHHDDLVRIELPLMEFLTQQALVDSAEPLTIEPKRQAGNS